LRCSASTDIFLTEQREFLVGPDIRENFSPTTEPASRLWQCLLRLAGRDLVPGFYTIYKACLENQSSSYRFSQLKILGFLRNHFYASPLFTAFYRFPMLDNSQSTEFAPLSVLHLPRHSFRGSARREGANGLVRLPMRLARVLWISHWPLALRDRWARDDNRSGLSRAFKESRPRAEVPGDRDGDGYASSY
jgi:hypothetical protein